MIIRINLSLSKFQINPGIRYTPSYIPDEKPHHTIGSRPIISFRKAMDGILFMFLELDVNSGRCCPKIMVLAQHAIGDFRRIGGLDRYFHKDMDQVVERI